MNKLFTRISMALVGIAMAVGVGVAAGDGLKDVVPVEASSGYYTITFATNSGDGTKGTANTTDMTSYTSSSYVTGKATTATNAYYAGGSGLKLGTSSASGSLGFGLATSGQVYATTVVINAKRYNSSKEATIKFGSLTAQTITNSTNFNDYTFTVNSNISSMTLTTSKYAWIASIKVNYTYYKVTYDGNGSNGGTTPTDSTEYKSGASVTVAANTFTRTNYNFVNWNTSSDGNGTDREVGDTFSITDDVTLYAQWEPSGTAYTVSGSITNGSLSSTESIPENNPLAITLVPSTHYHLPTSLTSVTMGGNALTAGSGYTYNNSTGAIGIAEVTGDVVITATCVEDAKYTVTYTKGTGGTGSDYVVANQYEGSYTLVSLVTTGITANSGYTFKCYTIGGDEYAPGDSITLSSNTTVTVTFVAYTYATLVTSTSDLWDGQEVYFSSVKYNGSSDTTAVLAKAHNGSDTYLSTTSGTITEYGICNETVGTAAKYTIGRVKIGNNVYYTFSNNGYYLQTTSTGSNYIGRTDTLVDGTTYCTYWTISLSNDGVATISSKSNTGRGELRYNYNNGSPRFTCYKSDTTMETFYLYAVTAYDENTVASAFVDNYMHMDANVSGQCNTYYPLAKPAWNALSDDEKLNVSVNHDDAYARLEAWAAAKGDSLDGEMNLVSAARVINPFESNISEGNVTLIIVIVSLVGLTAIGGYLILRRHKEQ